MGKMGERQQDTKKRRSDTFLGFKLLRRGASLICPAAATTSSPEGEYDQYACPLVFVVGILFQVFMWGRPSSTQHAGSLLRAIVQCPLEHIDKLPAPGDKTVSGQYHSTERFGTPQNTFQSYPHEIDRNRHFSIVPVN